MISPHAGRTAHGRSAPRTSAAGSLYTPKRVLEALKEAKEAGS